MRNSNIIKLAIADDHKIFREGLKLALSEKQNLKIYWEAEDGKEMLNKVATKKPDVLLMDINMPEIDGINAIQQIRKANDDIKIIILSMYDDQQMISKMMEIGANSYLTKTTDPDEIYTAIESCVNEEFYFNDNVNKAVMGKLMQRKNVRHHYGTTIPVKFTDNEIKLLKLIAEEKTTEEISKSLFLSPRTIETMRLNMKNKVDAKTIGGLILYGMRNKLIE